MASKIYRLHYRGQLKEDFSSDILDGVIQNCVQNVRKAQADGSILTAALYRSDRMLFFYYEAVGEPLAVAEPITAAEYGGRAGTSTADSGGRAGTSTADSGGRAGTSTADSGGRAGTSTADSGGRAGASTADSAGRTEVSTAESAMTGKALNGSGSRTVLPESGEDVQAACLRPEELLMPLNDYLQLWPGQKGDRLWVHMYHIYYHSVPENPEQWKRAAVPEKRRGRIAFLRDEKLFSYTYFHKAIVDEGLLAGDRYQSIALHENILFSYFEEPKTFVNVQGDTSRESQVIRDWLAVDPESHFIHMPQGKGENFMFLPALFALGVEEM